MTADNTAISARVVLPPDATGGFMHYADADHYAAVAFIHRRKIAVISAAGYLREHETAHVRYIPLLRLELQQVDAQHYRVWYGGIDLFGSIYIPNAGAAPDQWGAWGDIRIFRPRLSHTEQSSTTKIMRSFILNTTQKD